MIILSKHGTVEVDAIVYNAHFHTPQKKSPSLPIDYHSNQAMAISKGKIVAIGDVSFIQLKYYSENLINLHGNFVYPSFSDSHVHLLGVGIVLLQANLVGLTSTQAILEKLRSQPAYQGWIQGYGWDQNLWAVHSFPTVQELDTIFPNIPVWLWRVDGHAVWTNSAGLRLAGITKNTPEPQGGKILRDEHGNPSGVLLDNAILLLKQQLPSPSPEIVEKALTLAIQECLRQGVTCVHDAGQNWDTIQLYKKFCDEGKMPIRIYAMLDGMDPNNYNEEIIRQCPQNYANEHLTVRSIKLYSDGALGSRGAYLLEDYSDSHDNRGVQILTETQLISHIQNIAHYHFQPCIHAIGDGANRTVLNALEQALTPEQRQTLRPRIEHAQVLHPSDIPRFKKLGVIASIQPTHATSDMAWVAVRLGEERLQTAYPWQSLNKTGCHLIGGSDAPIERISPLEGIYASITRQDHAGNPMKGWYPDQVLSRQQAIDLFTCNPAYGSFSEQSLGSLEPGKWADFVILDRNIAKIPAKEIIRTKIVQTYIAGQAKLA